MLDYGEQDGLPYLVMEYLPGGTLKQQMGKPLPWREAVPILMPVARALDFAHRQGMAHRDVKPSNILITADGDPMLTDFGIAKLLDLEEGQTLTATGVGIGTPEYMSPEQGVGKPVDARTDVYSLGVVLYELVTGRKPYTADTPMAVVVKHISEPLPPPSQYVRDLPEAVEQVLLKMLAKQPEERYASMAGLVKAFETLTGQPNASLGKEKGRKVEVREAQAPSTPDPEATIEQGIPVETILPAEPPPPQRRRQPHWALGAGALAIIVILVILGVLFSEEIQVTFFSTRTPTSIPTSRATATLSISRTPTASYTFTITPIPEGYAVVPDVSGMSLLEAEAMLIELGFPVSRLWILGSSYEPGIVDHIENMSPGDIVSTYTEIVLAVSGVLPTSASGGGGSSGTSLCPSGYIVRTDWPSVNPACVLILGPANNYPDKTQACLNAVTLAFIFPNWGCETCQLECYCYPP